MMNNVAITVIGAGSYGTALAIALSSKGNHVSLWSHRAEHAQQMIHERCNKRYLPDISFPASLFIEQDITIAVQQSRDILIAVPSHAFADILQAIKPHLRQDSRIVWATKGLEEGEHCLLSEVASDILGNTVPFAVVSGPTFAKELARCMPTAIDIASKNLYFLQDLSELLDSTKVIKGYISTDIIGVQLGGALKNVIAIAIGILDQEGFGANARISLMTKGLAEIASLGTAMGANKDTFMGMSGLGDLVLTSTDNQSRNRRFGLLLGQGKTVEEALECVGQVVEGYSNVKEAYYLSKKHHVKMPIIEQMYQVLYCQKNPKEAIEAFFS